MTRPRGMPPTPRARSNDTLPVEMAEMSCTRGSSLPRRMTAPLPNCFSMAATASLIAFSFSVFVTRFLRWYPLYACTEVRQLRQDPTRVRHSPRNVMKTFRSNAEHAEHAEEETSSRVSFFGGFGVEPSRSPG